MSPAILALHLFERTALPRELRGQIVEPLGMGGALAHHPEVIGCADDALAERVLPEPVDQDTRQQRIGSGGHALCQLQSAAALLRAQRSAAITHFQKATGHHPTRRPVVAAQMDRLVHAVPVRSRKSGLRGRNARFQYCPLTEQIGEALRLRLRQRPLL